MVGTLVGSAMDILDGSADLSCEVVELGLLGVSGAEVVGDGESVGVVGDPVELDGGGEPELEQVEGLEEEIVGCGCGDAAPVGLGELEVCSDGGDRGLEGVGDVLEGVSLLSEVVDSEAASALPGGDVHGCGPFVPGNGRSGH